MHHYHHINRRIDGLVHGISSVSDSDPCSFSTFCTLWREQFPRVKTVKYSDFAKCDTCEAAKKFMQIASDSVKRGARPRNGVNI